ncbi:MAG: hypothetical protein JEZ10_09325, partial [Verrucomicrobia bacterium]|nr:hypothetical protein [Verrucomicrobiota bacterium]
VALLLGLFFLVISVQKLMNPQAFAAAVFRGHIMPYPLVNIAALLFMSLEFVAAFAVVFMTRWRRAGLWILVSVLLIYTGCVTFNLLRDLNTVCGCFGSGTRMAAISWKIVARNLGLIAAALFALR